MKIEVTYVGRVTIEADHGDEAIDPEDEVEKVLAIATAELVKLVGDPVVSASLTTGQVEVALWAEGNSLAEAAQAADSAIRAAFHTAECNTSSWPTRPKFDEPPRVRVDWLTLHAGETVTA
jgi:hypothetical protein